MRKTWLPVAIAILLAAAIGSSTLALDSDQDDTITALESLLDEVDATIDTVDDSDDTELSALKERTKARIRDACSNDETSEQQRIRMLTRVRDFLQTAKNAVSRERLRDALRIMSQVADETELDLGEVCEQLQVRIRAGSSLDSAAEEVRELARTRAQTTAREQQPLEEGEKTQQQVRERTQEQEHKQQTHGGG